ncbi:MAG: protein kinase [Myxococcales bacterium]|nr:protein kinase [Myxococcales bacterium]
MLDFGLAALARDPRLAPKGAVFGTPEYMSPEQARGEEAALHADLYALGVLFFEMLTGQLPFRANDRDTLLEMQRTAPPPRPRQLKPEVTPAAEAICLRLLEKDVRKRYQDAHHLQEELKALQRSLPSQAWDVQSGDPQPAAPPPPPPPQGAGSSSGPAAPRSSPHGRARVPGRERAAGGPERARAALGSRRARQPPRRRGRELHPEARGAGAPRSRAPRRDRPQGGGARARGVARAPRGERRPRRGGSRARAGGRRRARRAGRPSAGRGRRADRAGPRVLRAAGRRRRHHRAASGAAPRDRDPRRTARVRGPRSPQADRGSAWPARSLCRGARGGSRERSRAHRRARPGGPRVREGLRRRDHHLDGAPQGQGRVPRSLPGAHRVAAPAGRAADHPRRRAQQGVRATREGRRLDAQPGHLVVAQAGGAQAGGRRAVRNERIFTSVFSSRVNVGAW